MKRIAAAFIATFTMYCCTSKKATENLPKDIALKPVRTEAQDADREQLGDLRAEIDSLVSSVTCNKVDDWRISPIGSKPCGGPAAYLAYPISLENEITPKITEYTTRQSDFNRKYGLMSDCALVPQPSGIRCENGKAVLITSNTVLQSK